MASSVGTCALARQVSQAMSLPSGAARARVLRSVASDGGGRFDRGERAVQSSEGLTELVKRAGSGEQDAWNAIVDRFENLLWSVGRAHRLDTGDAGDVVQTTWLRLLENLHRIEDPERLAGWLVTTARRESLRLLRRAGREVLDDSALDLADEGAPGVDAALLEQERDAALWQSFSLLPERCQRLLRILMAAEPAAYAQIAEAMDMPIGAIGPTRMRCLTKLRALTRSAGQLIERSPS